MRIVVPARQRDDRQLESDLDRCGAPRSVHRLSATGGHCSMRLPRALAPPVPAACATSRWSSPTSSPRIEHDVGAAASEEFLVEFANLLQDSSQPEGHRRPLRRRQLPRAARARQRARRRGLERAAGREGRRQPCREHQRESAFDDLHRRPERASRPRMRTSTPRSPMRSKPAARAAAAAATRSFTSDKADTDARVQSYDKVWVKHIKAALMENRFRLVQQPVASLQGDDSEHVRRAGAHDRPPGQGSAAGGIHGRRRAQRSAQEHRPLGRRRVAVVRRAAQARAACSCACRRTACAIRSFLDWLDNHMRASARRAGAALLPDHRERRRRRT